MRITIRHSSTYHYDGPPAATIQALRLTPGTTPGQEILSWHIEAEGYDQAAHHIDAFGNRVDLLAGGPDRTQIHVVASGVVETTDQAGIVGWTGEAITPAVFLRTTPATTASAGILALAKEAKTPRTLETLHRLMAFIHGRIVYDLDATHAHTTAVDAFGDGRGVCQDHSHIFISAARSLGIPARYVTGYLLLTTGDDAPAQHAWAEALVEDIGWIGFDPANCLCPTDRYVRLCTGLDAAGASPIRGIRRGIGTEALSVSVSVRDGSLDQAGLDQSQQ